MVKVISQDYKNTVNWTDADFANGDEIMEHPIELSAPLGPNFPKPIIKICRGSRVNDYFEVGALAIVSRKLRDEFERAKAEIEYFEVDLTNWNGVRATDEEFYFAHLLSEIDCFDFDRSVYTLNKWGDASNIRKIVLRPEAIGDADVFLVAKANMAFWFTTSTFVSRIESTNLRGMIFLSLDEVRIPPGP